METTFCTHKGYNTVAPCGKDCPTNQPIEEKWQEKVRCSNYDQCEGCFLGRECEKVEALRQAITTAVAKRELEIAWEISKYTPGFMVKSGKIDESDAPGYEKGRRFLSSLIFH